MAGMEHRRRHLHTRSDNKLVSLPRGTFRQKFVYSSLRRSEEHTSELQSQSNLVCRLLLEKKKTFSHRLTCSRSTCSRKPLIASFCTGFGMTISDLPSTSRLISTLPCFSASISSWPGSASS